MSGKLPLVRLTYDERWYGRKAWVEIRDRASSAVFISMDDLADLIGRLTVVQLDYMERKEEAAE